MNIGNGKEGDGQASRIVRKATPEGIDKIKGGSLINQDSLEDSVIGGDQPSLLDRILKETVVDYDAEQTADYLSVMEALENIGAIQPNVIFKRRIHNPRRNIYSAHISTRIDTKGKLSEEEEISGNYAVKIYRTESDNPSTLSNTLAIQGRLEDTGLVPPILASQTNHAPQVTISKEVGSCSVMDHLGVLTVQELIVYASVNQLYYQTGKKPIVKEDIKKQIKLGAINSESVNSGDSLGHLNLEECLVNLVDGKFLANAKNADDTYDIQTKGEEMFGLEQLHFIAYYVSKTIDRDQFKTWMKRLPEMSDDEFNVIESYITKRINKDLFERKIRNYDSSRAQQSNLCQERINILTAAKTKFEKLYHSYIQHSRDQGDENVQKSEQIKQQMFEIQDIPERIKSALHAYFTTPSNEDEHAFSDDVTDIGHIMELFEKTHKEYLEQRYVAASNFEEENPMSPDLQVPLYITTKYDNHLQRLIERALYFQDLFRKESVRKLEKEGNWKPPYPTWFQPFVFGPKRLEAQLIGNSVWVQHFEVNHTYTLATFLSALEPRFYPTYKELRTAIKKEISDNIVSRNRMMSNLTMNHGDTFPPNLRMVHTDDPTGNTASKITSDDQEMQKIKIVFIDVEFAGKHHPYCDGINLTGAIRQFGHMNTTTQATVKQNKMLPYAKNLYGYINHELGCKIYDASDDIIRRDLEFCEVYDAYVNTARNIIFALFHYSEGNLRQTKQRIKSCKRYALTLKKEIDACYDPAGDKPADTKRLFGKEGLSFVKDMTDLIVSTPVEKIYGVIVSHGNYFYEKLVLRTQPQENEIIPAYRTHPTSSKC